MAPRNAPSSTQSDTYNLHADTFVVRALNPEGKKFAGVNRLSALGESFSAELLLDYNCDLLKVEVSVFLWEGGFGGAGGSNSFSHTQIPTTRN